MVVPVSRGACIGLLVGHVPHSRQADRHYQRVRAHRGAGGARVWSPPLPPSTATTAVPSTGRGSVGKWMFVVGVFFGSLTSAWLSATGRRPWCRRSGRTASARIQRAARRGGHRGHAHDVRGAARERLHERHAIAARCNWRCRAGSSRMVIFAGPSRPLSSCTDARGFAMFEDNCACCSGSSGIVSVFLLQKGRVPSSSHRGALLLRDWTVRRSC